MKDSSTETISVEEAAARLGIGRNQAYQAAAAGKLPILRFGRRMVVPLPAFNRMLETAYSPCETLKGQS